VPKTNSILALACARIEAADGHLIVEGFDLTTFAQITVPADGALQEVVAPVHRLAALLGKGQGAELSVTGTRLAVGAASLECALPASELPEPFALPKGKLETRCYDGDQAALALDWLLPAISTDPERVALTGLCLEPGAWIATDGHRLHRCELPGFPGRPVLDVSACRVLLAFCRVARPEVVQVLYGDGFFMALSTGREMSLALISRATDAEAPKYDEVLPPNLTEPLHARVVADELDGVLARAYKVVGKGRGATLTMNGSLTVAARSPDDGEQFAGLLNAQRLEVDGPEVVKAHVNVSYLRDALRCAKGADVVVGWGGADAPMTVRHGTLRLAVVMPMRP
jgi:DNA polymerase III sliding clamp (beta) subunit (PCNA family)